MSESMICPVCGNEIPEDARFLCPHCHFELKWLDDDGEIEQAKQLFTGEWTNLYAEDEKTSTQNINIHKILVVIGFILVFFCLWILGLFYQLDAF